MILSRHETAALRVDGTWNRYIFKILYYNVKNRTKRLKC